MNNHQRVSFQTIFRRVRLKTKTDTFSSRQKTPYAPPMRQAYPSAQFEGYQNNGNDYQGKKEYGTKGPFGLWDIIVNHGIKTGE